jgi:hypothetical protein
MVSEARCLDGGAEGVLGRLRLVYGQSHSRTVEEAILKLRGGVADRRAMRLDLLLALASVAVILSPCLIEALRKYAFEREEKAQQHSWSSQNARWTL